MNKCAIFIKKSLRISGLDDEQSINNCIADYEFADCYRPLPLLFSCYILLSKIITVLSLKDLKHFNILHKPKIYIETFSFNSKSQKLTEKSRFLTKAFYWFNTVFFITD